MNPADKHIMRDDAELPGSIAAELIFDSIAVHCRGVVGSPISIASGPRSRPMR